MQGADKNAKLVGLVKGNEFWKEHLFRGLLSFLFFLLKTSVM